MGGPYVFESIALAIQLAGSVYAQPYPSYDLVKEWVLEAKVCAKAKCKTAKGSWGSEQPCELLKARILEAAPKNAEVTATCTAIHGTPNV